MSDLTWNNKNINGSLGGVYSLGLFCHCQGKQQNTEQMKRGNAETSLYA